MAALFVAACAAIFAEASCGNGLVVLPLKQCPDPCCGGNTANVDCAANQDVTCVEDADVCSARVYGCADGSYFVREPTQLPASCAGDGAPDDVTLIIFDDAASDGGSD